MQFDMAAVLDAMSVGVYVCDASGKLVLVNRTGLGFMGAKSLDDLRATAPQPFHLPAVRTEEGLPIPRAVLPLQRALAGEDVVHEMEVIDHTSLGKIVLRTRSTPIRDTTGAIVGAVKVAVDVTKEHELARVKDEFIRQAAHELKTPIAVIKATAETLSGAEHPAQAQLRALIRGVDRMDGLINSLLDLADLEGGFFSFSRFPVPLERVVTGALSRVPGAAARRIHVSAVHAIVQADEARLRRALYALIDNAIKYSPPTATVEVELTRRDATARIAVRDRGVGIAVAKQPHVFEKYFRAHAGTSEDAGGIGVGLFVAREIIRQHDGRIWFESEEDRGSVFYVELPIEAEAK